MKRIYLFLSTYILKLSSKGKGNIPFEDNFETYTSEYEFSSVWKTLKLSLGDWIFDDSGYFGKNSSNAPIYRSPNSKKANDYLFSPAFKFEAGLNYELEFLFKEAIGGNEDKMSVCLFTDTNESSMVDTIVDLGSFSSTEFILSETIFSVQKSGDYYIGFHAYSGHSGGAIVIDRFSIKKTIKIEKNELEKLIIYPNKNNNIINVINAENSVIHVSNSCGETIVRVENANSQNSINLKSFGEGEYIIKVEKNNTVIKKKVSLNKTKRINNII